MFVLKMRRLLGLRRDDDGEHTSELLPRTTFSVFLDGKYKITRLLACYLQQRRSLKRILNASQTKETEEGLQGPPLLGALALILHSEGS